MTQTVLGKRTGALSLRQHRQQQRVERLVHQAGEVPLIGLHHLHQLLRVQVRLSVQDAAQSSAQLTDDAAVENAPMQRLGHPHAVNERAVYLAVVVPVRVVGHCGVNRRCVWILQQPLQGGEVVLTHRHERRVVDPQPAHRNDHLIHGAHSLQDHVHDLTGVVSTPR